MKAVINAIAAIPYAKEIRERLRDLRADHYCSDPYNDDGSNNNNNGITAFVVGKDGNCYARSNEEVPFVSETKSGLEVYKSTVAALTVHQCWYCPNSVASQI